MGIAQMLGSMLGNNWAVGMMMHVLNGTVTFPLVYPGTPMAPTEL